MEALELWKISLVIVIISMSIACYMSFIYTNKPIPRIGNAICNAALIVSYADVVLLVGLTISAIVGFSPGIIGIMYMIGGIGTMTVSVDEGWSLFDDKDSFMENAFMTGFCGSVASVFILLFYYYW